MTAADRVAASVVIPAHDEAEVIERCLAALTADGQAADLEVVVVCNGCSDDTPARARRAAPRAKIVELPEASKTAALNAGDAAAGTVFPRLYVDADVVLDHRSALALVAGLERTDCAGARPRFELSGRPWIIRAFYDVWRHQPYLNDRMVGTGVYGLSEKGRSRFDRFPAITADDQFVMQLFSPEERAIAPGASFTVYPPYTIQGLINMRTRAYRGNTELARSGLAGHPPTGGAARALAAQAARGRILEVAVYVAVNAVARRRAVRSSGWERDESARTAL